MTSETQLKITYVLPDRRSGQGGMLSPIASLGLAQLVAQTPNKLGGCRVDVRVHDELAAGAYHVGTDRPDFLAFSSLTTGALRAYQIADEAAGLTSLNGRPILTMMGGVHATSLPMEALKHVNLVVRGECPADLLEYAFCDLLDRDAKYKRVLRLKEPTSHITRPKAVWNWLDRSKYILPNVTQSSAGCPFHCSFCSVTEVFGARMRPVSYDVLEKEISSMPRFSGLLRSPVAVIDDNFLQGVQAAHINHVLEVCRIFKRNRHTWVTEITVRTLIEAQERLDREYSENRQSKRVDLVETFADSGCRGLFFGIESVQAEGTGLLKSRTMSDTLALIKKCHANGIAVLGAFVLGVGVDEDEMYYKRILDFAIDKAQLEYAQFSINTPMPGASNFLSAVKNGDILDWNWEHYDAEHCVMRHPKLSITQLEDIHRTCYNEFYRWRSILSRTTAPLLAFAPGAARRLLPAVPVNVALSRANHGWNNRTDRFGRTPPLETPVPEALQQVELADGKDLFNVIVGRDSDTHSMRV